jgi:hypothetical protein
MRTRGSTYLSVLPMGCSVVFVESDPDRVLMAARCGYVSFPAYMYSSYDFLSMSYFGGGGGPPLFLSVS